MVAHRVAREPNPVRPREQHRVAVPVTQDRGDFPRVVEPGPDRAGDLLAGVGVSKIGQQPGAPWHRSRGHVAPQDRNRALELETESFIEPDMTRALLVGQQPDEIVAARIEQVEHRLRKPTSDARAPAIRMDGERPEQTDAAPVRHHARAGDAVLGLGDENAGRIGEVARPDERAVAAEGDGVGEAEERPEGESADMLGRLDIGLFERPDLHRHPAARTATSIAPMPSISQRMTSPGVTGPTPSGVPVMITSPG